MDDHEVVEGIVPIDYLQEVYPGFPFDSFFAYIQNLVPLDAFFAVAGVLAPSFVEIDGLVFLAENVEGIESTDGFFSTPFGNDRQTVQKYRNMIDLDALRMDDTPEHLQTSEHYEFALQTIADFWRMRLEQQFPTKSFVFEISPTGMFDEDWECMTFYSLPEA